MTRLYKLALNSSTIDSFVSEVLRWPNWFLTEEQKKFTKKDLREFWIKVKEANNG